MWEDRPRLKKAPARERIGRNGQWARSFGSSKEPWPLIEHWAAERHYHLIALKGERRLYRKETVFSLYKTLLEIRRVKGELRLSSWIEVAILLRILSLFQLPSIMRISAGGIWGIRTRRRACHDLNHLLFRFRESPVIGSNSFHWADLDFSTLLLFTLFVVPFASYLFALANNFELIPGLSPILLSSVALHLLILAGAALVLLGFHHLITFYFLKDLIPKIAVTTLTLISFVVATILTFTATQREFAETKWVFFCMEQRDREACHALTVTLDERTRNQMASLLRSLEKELGQKDP